MLRQTASSVLAVAFVLGLVGCASEVGNDGAMVGGSCVVSSECHAEARCLTGATWPNGYCATTCSQTEADEDGNGGCPDGSVCVEEEGGICVVECAAAADCRNTEDDGGYDCRELEVRGAGGTAMGCFGG